MSLSATASTDSVGWPRRRLWLALLAVSVALNLFFIAGALWIRMHPPMGRYSWHQRFQLVARELDLSPQQRASFDRFVNTMHERARRMHEESEPPADEAWREMASPNPNAAHVEALLTKAAQTRQNFQLDAAARTLKFLSQLSPAQRAKFVAIVHPRRHAWWGHRRRPPR